MTSWISLAFSTQHRAMSSTLGLSNDAADSSNVTTTTQATSKTKVNIFTRAHSLEIPDEEDTLTESEDALDVLCLSISEEFWRELVELPVGSESARPSKRLKHDPDLDFLCYDSPASVDITGMGTSPISGQCRKPLTRAKRISNKQKIFALRDEVKGLTAQLEKLEAKTLRRKIAAENKRRDVEVNRGCQVWQPIAARQLEQRQRAEEENAKLREVMKLQIQEAKRLRRVLERRTDHVVGLIQPLPFF